MEATASPQRIYETSIKNLPAVDRLQLVKLVLDDLMRDPSSWMVDEGDEWSEDDYADLARASLAHASRSLKEHS